MPSGFAGPKEAAGALYAEVAASFARRKKALTPAYERYVSEISSDDMALSLHASVLLDIICDVFSPASALDVGSGFSSYVLRLASARKGGALRVYSLDTDAAWLERSRAWIKEQGLEDTGFGTWTAPGEAPQISWDGGALDLVLLDAERPPQRNGFLLPVLERYCSPDTALLLDDLHMPSWRLFALETLMTHNFCHVDCKRHTLDRYGRYASLFLEIT